MAIRVQFDISDERWNDLCDLMNHLQIGTRKDLFNNSLAVFEWAVREIEQGRTIASVSLDRESYRELVMPWMAVVNGR